jgi:signal recognition particle subunit SRP54
MVQEKRGKKVATISLDVHRPGAPEQLQQLAKQNNLTAFVNLKEKNPEKILKEFAKELKKYEVVLIDTAGRHSLDKELVKEIKTLNKKVKPTETILVMPADIGQAAKTQSKEFQDAVKITGVIITRMDSTAKAGGALTACAETGAPVYFIGNGEKVNDLEEFNPENFLARLLGMGDLTSLMEKIKSAINETDQEKMQKQLEAGKITLESVIEQVKSMNQIGGFDKLKDMIPGMNTAKIPENLMQNQQDKIAKWEHILKSMTKEEKENPEILKKQTKRIGRIADGAGVNKSDIRTLLKQYDMLNDMMGMGQDMDMSQGMDEKQMKKLMKKFGKKKMKKFK